MSLPKLNEVLKHTLTIPSTGEKVKYRPYLVKEEKVLLQAFESKDINACLQAMCDTIDSCLDEKSNVNVSKLPTFDLEYMFLKIRSKSVGETSDIVIKCKECETPNPYSVDLDKIEMKVDKSNNIVAITDEIKIEMKYPSYESMMKEDLNDLDQMSLAFRMLQRSMVAIHTEEERIDIATEGKEEIEEFLNSMTTSQLEKVGEFIKNMPTLSEEVKFVCTKCGTENEITLSGLSDFF